MSKYDLNIGDEVYTDDGGPIRRYIIVSYKSGDNWAIVITKADGWHYALRSNKLIPTGSHYTFSDKLKREIEEAIQYSFNLPKRLLTNEHLQLVKA